MNEAVGKLSAGRKMWILFWEFAKITAVVLGGGYVILAAAEQVFVQKRRWLTRQDFLDMVVVAQTVPGIIAANGSIYIGWRVAGLGGALSALAGAALPPMAVITAVAACLEQMPVGNEYISGAMAGVNACVFGLITATAIKLGRKALSCFFEWFMALAVLTAVTVWHCNPGILLLCAIPCGIIYTAWKSRAMSKGGGA